MKTLVIFLAVVLTAGLLAAEVPLKAAVLTGGHGFDRKAFLDIFEDMPGIAWEHIHGQDHAGCFEDISGWDYDVMLMYTMSKSISEKARKNLVALLNRGAGLVVVHHAIANYPDWPAWYDIIGAHYHLAKTDDHDRSEYTHDIDIPIHIENPDHPITKGMEDFVIYDESYRKWDYLEGNNLLLTTTHPESNREIAWTRTYEGEGVAGDDTRIFFIQLGHGKEAYANPSYRELLRRGIFWTAKRLEGDNEADNGKE
jgi:uncharacterized protein